MPLTINVGLSRKASKDYQSTGTSINVVAELDQSLLARPVELQHQIDELYRQAQDALDRQAAGINRPLQPNAPTRSTEPAGRFKGKAARQDASRGNGTQRVAAGLMTESQRRAINAIATRLGIDPHLEARDIVGPDLDQLTIRQASELIDHLKSMSPAGNGRNGGGG